MRFCGILARALLIFLPLPNLNLPQEAFFVPILYERPILEPPADRWAPAIWQPQSSKLASLRNSARRSLQHATAQFLKLLAEVAHNSGLNLTGGQFAAANIESAPLLLTGHQPVVFHPGLVFKYQVTEAVAQSLGCPAVALVIDTDEGDPGAFDVPQTGAVGAGVDSPAVPSPAVSPLRRVTSTFSRGSGLYAACRLASSQQRSEVAAGVRQALESVGCMEAADAFSAAFARYARLPEDLPMVTANTLVRRGAGIGSRLAEVPFTSICGFPEVLRFFSDVLSRAVEFHLIYNAVLDNWRQQQGIRNDANPFPNLRSTPDALELPFWLVDTGRGIRSAAWLHVAPSNRSSVPSIGDERQPFAELPRGLESEGLLSLRLAGQLLVPRGALITATLRLLFADLFIHGLGGGRYDPATDELIRRWWQETPPPFAVASASMCLFPGERAVMRRLQEFRSQSRELQFNPGRFLDQPLFSPAQALEIRSLLSDKQVAVEELGKHRSAGTSGRETGRRLQQLSDAIRGRVAEILRPHLEAAGNISEETVSTVESRTWPWFYFPGDWDLATRGFAVTRHPNSLSNP
ncbi:MAG: hypothetical protein ACKOEO_10995 [Planctomycetaceae bacterium]